MLGIMMGNEKKSKIQKTAFEEMFCYFFYVKYTLRHRKNIALPKAALKLAQKTIFFFVKVQRLFTFVKRFERY